MVHKKEKKIKTKFIQVKLKNEINKCISDAASDDDDDDNEDDLFYLFYKPYWDLSKLN